MRVRIGLGSTGTTISSAQRVSEKHFRGFARDYGEREGEENHWRYGLLVNLERINHYISTFNAQQLKIIIGIALSWRLQNVDDSKALMLNIQGTVLFSSLAWVVCSENSRSKLHDDVWRFESSPAVRTGLWALQFPGREEPRHFAGGAASLQLQGSVSSFLAVGMLIVAKQRDRACRQAPKIKAFKFNETIWPIPGCSLICLMKAVEKKPPTFWMKMMQLCSVCTFTCAGVCVVAWV